MIDPAYKAINYICRPEDTTTYLSIKNTCIDFYRQPNMMSPQGTEQLKLRRAPFQSVSKSGERVSTRTEGENPQL